ncbi:hypothetical protein [Gorillibacterium timonense]|uniref:hypothetical protein n=1 Tax=Gorillibacterium timonense TaxID=1689269 RepID=UPI00071DB4FB|nr:hypothetical protein [Gorillibacterium timonense]
MEDKPYFCPNCRSNRYKFSRITTFSTPFRKDAITGVLLEKDEPVIVPDVEDIIQCQVCQFTGNEMRFIKQAEREPRTQTTVPTMYT